MEFRAITERAREVRRLFEAVERDAYGRSWSLEELALGLGGDVGDLAKLVQAREGVRKIDDVQTRLDHELADVLWGPSSSPSDATSISNSIRRHDGRAHACTEERTA